MNNTLFQPGCPWYDLHLNHPPNVDWCEEKLCSFIVTPFNTWTNLAFILVGFLMWRRTRNSENDVLRFFSTAAVLVGFSSLIYHATLNYFTQVFDFFGMYLFTTIMLMANLRRTGKWPTGKAGSRLFWIWVFSLTTVTSLSFLIHIPSQIYVLFLVIAIVVTELKQTAKHRKYFWASCLCMLSAGIISALDAARVLCFPENHWFQGHGVWHLITATALWFAFLHTENEMNVR